MIADSIYRLGKYDCDRAYKYKLAYFTSKYLNLFRTCDSELNVNDLVNSGNFSNCTTGNLSSSLSKKYCTWFEIVCKYPIKCLKSMSWVNQ